MADRMGQLDPQREARRLVMSAGSVMQRTDLCGLVDATPAPELPQLIGDLEAAKAAAWARLTTTPANIRTEEPTPEVRNLDIGEAARRLGMSRDWL